LDDAPDWAIALLSDARVGHLGLLDRDGWPLVLPVTYAVVAGDVWTAVDQKPKRRPAEDIARWCASWTSWDAGLAHRRDLVGELPDAR
jgi:hypothetical protein